MTAPVATPGEWASILAELAQPELRLDAAASPAQQIKALCARLLAAEGLLSGAEPVASHQRSHISEAEAAHIQAELDSFLEDIVSGAFATEGEDFALMAPVGYEPVVTHAVAQCTSVALDAALSLPSRDRLGPVNQQTYRFLLAAPFIRQRVEDVVGQSWGRMGARAASYYYIARRLNQLRKQGFIPSAGGVGERS